MPSQFSRFAVLLAAAAVAGTLAVRAGAQEPFRFRSGVELINVTVTVTDRSGRFVEGLRQEDFRVYENDRLQEISHFSNEPVPVSLGIALDVSGSMTVERMDAARAAISRLLAELKGSEDELLLATFATTMQVVQPWTTDRRAVTAAANRASVGGSTAMYDAIAELLPLVESGRNRKKALLVITDGNDNSSRTTNAQVRQQIRQTEVLVYALGVEESSRRRAFPARQQVPWPFPRPGQPGPGRRFPPQPIPPSPLPPSPPLPGGVASTGSDDSVDEQALRQITDGTGGRTEIVRGFTNLNQATSRLASELNKQYYLGYTRTGESDGRWNAIRVELGDRRLTIRARQGYYAS